MKQIFPRKLKKNLQTETFKTTSQQTQLSYNKPCTPAVYGVSTTLVIPYIGHNSTENNTQTENYRASIKTTA